MGKKLYITVNSLILYVVSFLVTTILHEFAHGLFGMFYASSPVIHHHYVEHLSTGHLTISQTAIISLAGPVTSLMQGVVSGIVFLRLKNKGLLSLFLLWLAVLGFNNVFGYLMTGPIFTQGDIGKAYQVLDTPLFFQIMMAVVGAGLLLLLAYKLTRPFFEFCPDRNLVSNPQSRANFSFHILILPWIAGSAIMTILYLPIVAIVSIIYPIMSGMVFIFPWQNARRIENVEISSAQEIDTFSLRSFAVLVVLILVFKVILAPGIKL